MAVDRERQPMDLEATMRLMDVADEIRRSHRQVERHLEQTDREAIKRHIRERYEALGETPDPELLDEAIDRFLSEQHRFREPEPGLGTTLAGWYVHRRRIALRVGLPVLVVLAIALVLWVAKTGVEAARQRSRQAAIEATDRGLRDAREQLERSLAEAVAAAPPASVLERARSIHARGAAGVERRDLDAARAHVDELAGLVDDVRDLPTLKAELPAVHGSIVGIAKEPAAIELADELRDRGLAAVAAGDVTRLRDTLAEMRRLDRTLGLVYDVTITGGVWRYKDDNRSIKNYYLIVKATDAGGRAVPLPVTNEETRQTENVSEWAERVPQAAYNRVGADKQDNGIIDDDRFGVKRRGYLEIERRFENVGQITRW